MFIYRTFSGVNSFTNPAETNAGLTLARLRRRWTNINPALVQRLVFAGKADDDIWMNRMID